MDNLPMFEEVVKVLIDCPRRLLFHKVKVLQRWNDSQNCHVIPEIKENNGHISVKNLQNLHILSNYFKYCMSVKQNYFNNDRLHVKVQVTYFYP